MLVNKQQRYDHIVILRREGLRDQPNLDLYLTALLPLAVNTIVILSQPGGGEDHLGRRGRLPDTSELNVWLYVDSVLEDAPVRLGDQLEVVFF